MTHFYDGSRSGIVRIKDTAEYRGKLTVRALGSVTSLLDENMPYRDENRLSALTDGVSIRMQ